MKKDITFPTVEGIKIVVSCTENEPGHEEWNVYIINDLAIPVENVIVVSRGYGEPGEEQQKTSTLRQLIGHLPAGTALKVEPIDPALFHLFNEYWVSYYIGDQIYDKKFIFVPDSIVKDNLRYVPQLDMKGVLHE
jgi:hypothetical protein